MYNLILCGGVGSRLWPLSRTQVPKQFARLLPGDSLFESTVRRNRTLCGGIAIASNREQAFLAANQLGRLGVGEWLSLIEPVGRNTAPAIALACKMLPGDEIVLVTPSDHVIRDEQAYFDAVKEAEALARTGKIVTFGIKPEYPETGFGYLEASRTERNKLVSFREKPDEASARSYIEQGNYYWNSGMFCFPAGLFLEELRAHAPDISRACDAAFGGGSGSRVFEPTLDAMRAIPSLSVDYAVMEKTTKAAIVPCSIGWSDLGSFDALYDHLYGGVSFDEHKNAFACAIEPVLVNSHGNLIINGERQVALIDVDDLLVVETPDALLVAKKGSSQKVKLVVDELKSKSSKLVDTFPVVERPWGSHEVLMDDASFRVNKIVVLPGKHLSLHRHGGRRERWVVLEGRAEILVGSDVVRLAPGDTCEAVPGEQHQVRNTGEVSLVLVESQYGDTSDADIERYAE